MPSGETGEPGASSALRLRVFTFGSTSIATGLVALLFTVDWPPRGLLPLLMFGTFGLGALGLVARLAMRECPPWFGDKVGEVARDPGAGMFVLMDGRGVGVPFGFGVCDLDSTFCCCSWIADAAVGRIIGSSSSSSSSC